MKTSIKGLIEICGSEGICLSPYLDSVGVVTIGVGATKSEIPDLSLSHPNITVKQAMELFKSSIVKYERAIDKALKVEITQEQYDSLASVCYNIGTGGLSGSTFIKRINSGESPNRVAAAIQMWNKPKEIMGRRNKEALLYEHGVYSNKGMALLFPVNSKHKPVYSQGVNVNVLDYL